MSEVLGFKEEFEVAKGHVFIINEELLERKTTLGQIARDYVEKKRNATCDEDIISAINDMFMTIFYEINGGNANLGMEFRNQLVKSEKR